MQNACCIFPAFFIGFFDNPSFLCYNIPIRNAGTLSGLDAETETPLMSSGILTGT